MARTVIIQRIHAGMELYLSTGQRVICLSGDAKIMARDAAGEAIPMAIVRATKQIGTHRKPQIRPWRAAG